MLASHDRSIVLANAVERLWDKPTEEIKGELDKLIPEYFRRDDHAPLSDMVSS